MLNIIKVGTKLKKGIYTLAGSKCLNKLHFLTIHI